MGQESVSSWIGRSVFLRGRGTQCKSSPADLNWLLWRRQTFFPQWARLQSTRRRKAHHRTSESQAFRPLPHQMRTGLELPAPHEPALHWRSCVVILEEHTSETQAL